MLYQCVYKWFVHNAYIGQTLPCLHLVCTVCIIWWEATMYVWNMWCSQHNSYTNFLLAWLWPKAMKKNEHMSIHREVNMSQIREMICVRPFSARDKHERVDLACLFPSLYALYNVRIYEVFFLVSTARDDSRYILR